MSPEDIRQKVVREVGSNWGQTSLHGVDLRKCLLAMPALKTYANSFYDTKLPDNEVNSPTIELWLVLEEDPAGKKGYEIVYDERSDQFGLAAGRTFIGYYGGFLDTVEGM